jgi:hypothetical protein
LEMEELTDPGVGLYMYNPYNFLNITHKP